MFNTLQGKSETKQLIKERSSICATNKCRYYDAQGSTDKAVIKGKPACAICGCNIAFLTSLPESRCSLHELNQTPLWESKTN